MGATADARWANVPKKRPVHSFDWAGLVTFGFRTFVFRYPVETRIAYAPAIVPLAAAPPDGFSGITHGLPCSMPWWFFADGGEERLNGGSEETGEDLSAPAVSRKLNSGQALAAQRLQYHGPTISIPQLVRGHFTNAMTLLKVTDRGLYCAAGDFIFDPWKPVDFAVTTHCVQRPRAFRFAPLLPLLNPAARCCRNDWVRPHRSSQSRMAGEQDETGWPFHCIRRDTSSDRRRCAWNIAARSGW